MNNKRSIAFTVELLGLFILLILVIVMITQVFVMSRARTIEARHLTQAVMMAQSTAEAASSEHDLSVLAEKLKDMDNVQSAEASGDSLSIVFDTDGNLTGKDFCIVLHRAEEERDSGVYTRDNIEVYYCVPGQTEGKIYDLSTGSHFTAEEVGS
jgi:type II secretory pathway pseudopilin PulG